MQVGCEARCGAPTAGHRATGLGHTQTRLVRVGHPGKQHSHTHPKTATMLAHCCPWILGAAGKSSPSPSWHPWPPVAGWRCSTSPKVTRSHRLLHTGWKGYWGTESNVLISEKSRPIQGRGGGVWCSRAHFGESQVSVHLIPCLSHVPCCSRGDSECWLKAFWEHGQPLGDPEPSRLSGQAANAGGNGLGLWSKHASVITFSNPCTPVDQNTWCISKEF